MLYLENRHTTRQAVVYYYITTLGLNIWCSSQKCTITYYILYWYYSTLFFRFFFGSRYTKYQTEYYTYYNIKNKNFKTTRQYYQHYAFQFHITLSNVTYWLVRLLWLYNSCIHHYYYYSFVLPYWIIHIIYNIHIYAINNIRMFSNIISLHYFIFLSKNINIITLYLYQNLRSEPSKVMWGPGAQ